VVDIRVCTIRPSYCQRGRPRGGGTDGGVSTTRGQCGVVLGSGPCGWRPACMGGASPLVGRPTRNRGQRSSPSMTP
jgi:hypothetical protein